jgi:hypothetical protein
VLKGFSDTLEHLLPFTIASLGWWLAVFTVVLAPGATIALFRAADPRAASDVDRPSLRDGFDTARRTLGLGWRLAGICLPVVAVLLWNLRFYGLRDSRVSLLAPLWIVLLLLAIFLTAAAFSFLALLDQPWRSALTGAATQTASQLPTALSISLLLWPVLILGGLLVVPIFMFLPATIAAVVNRFVLLGRGEAIPDPLTPTDERAREEAIARGRSRFGP